MLGNTHSMHIRGHNSRGLLPGTWVYARTENCCCQSLRLTITQHHLKVSSFPRHPWVKAFKQLLFLYLIEEGGETIRIQSIYSLVLLSTAEPRTAGSQPASQPRCSVPVSWGPCAPRALLTFISVTSPFKLGPDIFRVVESKSWWESERFWVQPLLASLHLLHVFLSFPWVMYESFWVPDKSPR